MLKPGKNPLPYAFSTSYLMTFQLVSYTGSPAADLWITAALWVNEAFVLAGSCHDLFEKCGIVFMRAHMLTYRALSLPVTHTHILMYRQKHIHQSLSHSEGGILKEAVSFLYRTVHLLFSLSSISLSVTPHPSSVVHPLLSLASRACGLTFLGSTSCLLWAGREEEPAVSWLARWPGWACMRPE